MIIVIGLVILIAAVVVGVAGDRHPSADAGTVCGTYSGTGPPPRRPPPRRCKP